MSPRQVSPEVLKEDPRISLKAAPAGRISRARLPMPARSLLTKILGESMTQAEWAERAGLMVPKHAVGVVVGAALRDYPWILLEEDYLLIMLHSAAAPLAGYQGDDGWDPIVAHARPRRSMTPLTVSTLRLSTQTAPRMASTAIAIVPSGTKEPWEGFLLMQASRPT